MVKRHFAIKEINQYFCLYLQGSFGFRYTFCQVGNFLYKYPDFGTRPQHSMLSMSKLKYLGWTLVRLFKKLIMLI